MEKLLKKKVGECYIIYNSRIYTMLYYLNADKLVIRIVDDKLDSIVSKVDKVYDCNDLYNFIKYKNSGIN